MTNIIKGLLYLGAYLFVGAPKLGKSFLMARLAYHVSTGCSLWNYLVHKGTVLYFALEDDYRRLQERLYQMFGTESAKNLHFAVTANQHGRGLNEQLTEFIRQHLDTRLIIIDTLPKVRKVCADTYSYANDYDIITQLKCFLDNTGVCLLLVHHIRKQRSDDTFDMISELTDYLARLMERLCFTSKSERSMQRRWKSRGETSKTKSCTSKEISKLLLGNLKELKPNYGKSRRIFCWNKSQRLLS